MVSINIADEFWVKRLPGIIPMCNHLNPRAMFKTLLLISCLLYSVFSCFGQNMSKFHHNLDQALIDKSGFKLYLKTSAESKETKREMKIVKQHPFEKKPFKAVVVLDKGLLLLDVWRIEDLTKGSSTDEFGNSKSNTSEIVNAGTPLAGATLYLSDDRMNLGEPTSVINIPFSAWSWSISTMPFRYRFKTDSSNATLSANLSLNAAYGYTWGKTKFTSRLARNRSNTVAFFLGAGTADIKPATVKTPVRWDRDKTNGTADRTNGAISYGFSYTRAVNNFGLVASIGIDTAFGPGSGQWSYQNKPWIGLGINAGLGIFK